MSIASRSLILLTQLRQALSRLGIKAGVSFRQHTWEGYVRRVGEVRVWGSANLLRWMRTIGFANLRNLTKYAIWEDYGFCPPRTTFMQRALVLSEKLRLYPDSVAHSTRIMAHSDRRRLVCRLLRIIHDRYGIEYSTSGLDLKERPLLFTM